MFEKCNRSLVKGFLRADGQRVVNGDGREIILTGWGLGNWLLPEGYMWQSGGGNRFDRPRRIEQVITELTGTEYAAGFWRRFRESYTAKDDIRHMAELGYNSVRVPINWRVLMEDEPGIKFKEEGFALLDNCLGWCEEFGIYVFFDLHGAPGGQTGHNIDDSVDDLPRLFMDADSWQKGIALWEEIARRYKDRWIVGGYDLLNEPVRPGFGEGLSDPYLPKLIKFYGECIAAIRKIDGVHMLSIEGHHWATNNAVFCKHYDGNALLHFHRYSCMPGAEAFKPYIDAARRWNMPLWLGETGENIPGWFAAMFPLSVSLGIGYNLWPWKKMQAKNSPCSVKKPDGWDEIIAYTKGGARPSYERAREIFDEYLENIKFENCAQVPEVTNAAFRRPPFALRATDFNEKPGKGVSFSGTCGEGNPYGFRNGTGMRIEKIDEAQAPVKRFFFDCNWDSMGLRLEAGEYAEYGIGIGSGEDCAAAVELRCDARSALNVSWNGELLGTFTLNEGRQELPPLALPSLPAAASPRDETAADCGTLRVEVSEGSVLMLEINVK